MRRLGDRRLRTSSRIGMPHSSRYTDRSSAVQSGPGQKEGGPRYLCGSNSETNPEADKTSSWGQGPVEERTDRAELVERAPVSAPQPRRPDGGATAMPRAREVLHGASSQGRLGRWCRTPAWFVPFIDLLLAKHCLPACFASWHSYAVPISLSRLFEEGRPVGSTRLRQTGRQTDRQPRYRSRAKVSAESEIQSTLADTCCLADTN